MSCRILGGKSLRTVSLVRRRMKGVTCSKELGWHSLSVTKREECRYWTLTAGVWSDRGGRGIVSLILYKASLCPESLVRSIIQQKQYTKVYEQ